MDSWKKNLPDYKWKLWSLKDFDVNSLSWTKEAFSVGALAFVADYVRLHALYTEGGIYMDTDVMVKNLLIHYYPMAFYCYRISSGNDRGR